MPRILQPLCVGRLATEAVTAAVRGAPTDAFPVEPRAAMPDELPSWGARAGTGPAVSPDAVVVGLEGAIADLGALVLRVRTVLPTCPLIGVVRPADRAEAAAMLRLGLADFLVAGEFDSTSLHRVVWHAQEGQALSEWLLRNHELFHPIWGNLTDLVAVVGPDGRRLYNSPGYRALLGEPAALLGTDSFREIHPDDRERVREAHRRSFETGVGERVEFRFVRPDGTIRYIESQGVIVPGREGAPARLVVVGCDKTERRAFEAELREREEFHRRISDNMSDLVAVIDPEGRRLYNSPSYRLLFGGDGPVRESDSFAEIHPDDRARIREVFQQTVATGKGRRAEYRFVMPNGAVRFLESVGSAILDEHGRTAKVLVVSRDTTERRQAEEALAQERNLLRTLIDLLPDFIYVKDRSGRFILNNRAHADLVGREDPAELLGRTDREVFPAELAGGYEADDRAIAESGEPILNREEPVRDRAGRQLWVLTTKVPLRNAAGEITGLVGMSRDITARRHAEEELRASQERLELVIRGGRDGVWDWNVATNEVYFSPRWKSMVGYAEHEVPDTFEGWTQLIHPEDLERAMRTIQEYFAGSSTDYALEHRLRHKDGSYRWILARGVALRDPSGRPLRMAGSHVDLTERRRTEERLRQAARWESVTTLAAGVAHEVKNPLQTILLGIEYLTDRPFAAEGAVAELLASMANAAHQADTIIRALRDYAIQRQPQCRPGNLNDLITEALKLLDYDFHRHQIEVTQALVPVLPAVCFDAEQMKQVCWIVFRNAIDALVSRDGPRGLAIRTTIEERRPEGLGAASTGPTAGGWVVMQVDDTGPGVKPEILPRVFDLFFTTKQSAKGSGIGLALARRILDTHGGFIDLANRPEGGVRVTLAIPVPVDATDCSTCSTPLRKSPY